MEYNPRTNWLHEPSNDLYVNILQDPDDPRTQGWNEDDSGDEVNIGQGPVDPFYVDIPYEEDDPRTHFGRHEPVKSPSKGKNRVKRKRTGRKQSIDRLEKVIQKLTECLAEAQMELQMQSGGTVPASHKKPPLPPKWKRSPNVKKQEKINAIMDVYKEKKTKKKTRRTRRGRRGRRRTPRTPRTPRQ